MNPQNNPARIRAKRVLRHYFSLTFDKVGLVWRMDNDAEINTLVDDIIDAAVDQMRAERSMEPGGINNPTPPARSLSEPDTELGW
jgi:hypothetical protein